MVGSWDDSVEVWCALRTAANWEKKLATLLHGAGVPAYVPTLSRVVQYAGKQRCSDVPLFSGYVFCSEQDFIGGTAVPAAARKQVAQVLRPPRPEQLRAELAHVAAFLADHNLVQERIHGEAGDTVRIVAGPLKGREGVLLARKGEQRRVVLEVQFLNARLEVELDEHLIRKV